MRTFAALMLLSCSTIMAETIPETSTVSSTNAAYDGNALVLKGHVLLDHGLGKMTADEAALERQEAGKDFPFSLIHLKKDVILNLKNNGELKCNTADLDFVSLKGVLHSSEKDKVVYSDTLKKKDGAKAIFCMMSKVVEIEMSKKSQDEKKPEYDLETVLAKEDVIIDYAQSFTLRAGHALYRKAGDKKSAQEFQGIITAYPKDKESKCRLTHEGDVIDADSVDLDLIESKLTMHRPVGLILSPIIPHAKGAVRFSSDHLQWDHLKNALLLKGRIVIQESALGTLTTDDELHLMQTMKKGERSLSSIRSKGNTVLTYKDQEGGSPRTISSHGSLMLDREKMQAHIDSPEKNGKVSEDMQLYYEEDDVGIHANTAALEYSIVGTHLQPVSLSLKGNVRLLSRESDKPKRFGLADRLAYSPATRTVILSANPGKKVLFWDEDQSMRISAQEVHITQDLETKKENIKGIGNVKFSYTTEEADLLKKYMPNLNLKIPSINVQ